MTAVTRADWHVTALADDDTDPFADVDVDGYAEAVTFGVEVDLDLVAAALGVVDLTASDDELWRWGNELERRDRSMAGRIHCAIRKPGACLNCATGDQLLANPAGSVISVLCRNSRRLELVEQEVDARLARRA